MISATYRLTRNSWKRFRSGLRRKGKSRDEEVSGKGEIMKISARNILKGRVRKITPGSVNSEVTLELPNGGGEITSIITKKAVENLGLQVGSPAYAVIKSSEVMIAVDE